MAEIIPLFLHAWSGQSAKLGKFLHSWQVGRSMIEKGAVVTTVKADAMIEPAIAPPLIPGNAEKKQRFMFLLLCVLLAALTVAVYGQVASHQFINFDDPDYVTNNPHVTSGLSWSNAAWAFTSIEAYNWHPLTWLSHQLDVQLFGLNPGGHHLTSVAIHICAALLLFALLLRLSGALWQSFTVAALFALHPLHVESVAWVAERKDVLSAFFCFLTMLLYVEYVRKKSALLYSATLVAYLLGIMAKPMLVSLPLLLLLLDYWPLQRGACGGGDLRKQTLALLTEKIPFFFCALGSCAITLYAQKTGGAVVALSAIPVWYRCVNALVAYVSYIGKTLYPHNLAVVYPFSTHLSVWAGLASLSVLLLLTYFTVRVRFRYPYLVVGWFWFVITLIPVIGIIQVGSQAMADRYTYIPCIGLFVMVAWGVPEFFQKRCCRKYALPILLGFVIATSAIASWRQLKYWRDDYSLYEHALQVTTENVIVHNNLGIALQADGDVDSAIAEYEKGLLINSNYEGGKDNLAKAQQAIRDCGEAIVLYQQMLQQNPNNINAHRNLGVALASSGDVAGAIREYQEVIRLDPTDTDGIRKLKVAMERLKSGAWAE